MFLRSLAPSVLIPQLQLPRARARRNRVPTSIPPAFPLSDGRLGAGEGGWTGNRRADAYSVGLGFARSRVGSPTVGVGGARSCREGVPLWCVCPSDVDEAMAATTLRNNAPTLPCPAGSRLRCWRRVRELLYRIPGPVIHRLDQVMLLLVSFLFGAEPVVGDEVGGQLDLARSSLGGGCRRWCVQIQGLEGLRPGLKKPLLNRFLVKKPIRLTCKTDR